MRRKVKSGAKDIAKAIATGEAPDLIPRKLLLEDKVKAMSQLHQKIWLSKYKCEVKLQQNYEDGLLKVAAIIENITSPAL